MCEFEEQWNDMTELHQNETTSIREEIERTFECIERIEYRFADKNSQLGEQIEGMSYCISLAAYGGGLWWPNKAINSIFIN